MKKLLIACLTLAFFGCSSTSVDVNKIKYTVADKVSVATAEALECNRKDLIREDILTLLKYEGVPADMEVRGIGATLCKMAVTNVLPVLVKTGIPNKWECKLTSVDNLIEFVGNSACSFIP
jgi:hypothetical protein